LNDRRVFRFTYGSWPQTVQCHRFQKPRGRSGIQNRCPTSNVRICAARRAPSHERQ
jgi:hypothetical protein